jgi:hypothetical protein
MSLINTFNVGAFIKAKTAVVNTAITQSSAALATTQDGVTIDRNAAGLRRYYSCKAIVSGVFVGATTAKSATLLLNVQHSSDGTSWDNYSTGTAPAAVTLGPTSNSTNGTEYGTIEQSVNLNGARRYLRVQIPPTVYSDCSSGSAFTGHGVIVFGGADELPAQ